MTDDGGATCREYMTGCSRIVDSSTYLHVQFILILINTITNNIYHAPMIGAQKSPRKLPWCLLGAEPNELPNTQIKVENATDSMCGGAVVAVAAARTRL